MTRNRIRWHRPLALFVAVCAIVPAILATGAIGATEQARRREWDPAEGVTLTRIGYRTPRNEVRVLRVDTSLGAGLDIRTPGAAFPARARTSTMAAAQSIAIAGVNGGYPTVRGAGGPLHALMVDGELWSSGYRRHSGVGWNADGTRAYAGPPMLAIRLHGADGSPLLDIRSFNAPLAPFKANAYSRRAGSEYSPPGSTDPSSGDPKWCAARLVPAGDVGWIDVEQTGIGRSYTVVAQPEQCGPEPLGYGTDPGAVVVAARTKTLAGQAIFALTPGDPVSLRWSFLGWPGVTDVIGGVPMIVDDGTNVTAPFNGDVHPRTALGLTQGCSDADPVTTCEFIVLTVDGRQRRWSRGMALSRLADELLAQGSWDAINLDGGGSTTMWLRKRNPHYCQSVPEVRGCLVNRPSDGQERSLIMGLTVIRQLDTETPYTLTGIAPSPTPTPTPTPTPSPTSSPSP
jgi:hypothetical protein